MKEELINFETSKFAKEKGFNIPTLYGCNYKGELQEYITYESYSPGEPEVRIDDFIRKWEYQLPTQSLLKKWLREVHKLHISIVYDENCINNAYYYKICSSDGFIQKRSKAIYKEYEETLEAGLQKALKLI